MKVHYWSQRCTADSLLCHIMMLSQLYRVNYYAFSDLKSNFSHAQQISSQPSLTCSPGSRKFAVVVECCFTGCLIDLLPRAIPTIAVMCVSAPYTCIGTPSVSPTQQQQLLTTGLTEIDTASASLVYKIFTEACIWLVAC